MINSLGICNILKDRKTFESEINRIFEVAGDDDIFKGYGHCFKSDKVLCNDFGHWGVNCKGCPSKATNIKSFIRKMSNPLFDISRRKNILTDVLINAMEIVADRDSDNVVEKYREFAAVGYFDGYSCNTEQYRIRETLKASRKRFSTLMEEYNVLGDETFYNTIYNLALKYFFGDDNVWWRNVHK